MIPNQLRAVQILTEQDCIVVCAGGGGIPVLQVDGRLQGIEAVIDKDRAATMMGLSLKADGLLILTDVPGVAVDYKTDRERWIKNASPGALKELTSHFPDGSMGPKVEAACNFVSQSHDGWAAIGSLQQADKILTGEAGTTIKLGPDRKDFIEFYESDITEKAA
jgi:carbamate kinase